MSQDPELAKAHLKSLQADSEHLMKYTQSAINQLEAERNNFHQQLKEVEGKIGEYGWKEESLKRDHKRTEAALDIERRKSDALR